MYRPEMETLRGRKVAVIVDSDQAVGVPTPRQVSPLLRKVMQGLPGLPLAIWVGLFVGVPGVFMLIFSFMSYGWYSIEPPFTFHNYINIIEASAYGKLFLKTLIVAVFVTVTTLVVASPFAYYIARVATPRLAIFLLLLTVLPLWTNEVIRNYSWYPLVARNGIFDSALRAIGFADPGLMFSLELVIVVAVSLAMPFAVLVLYATMVNIGPEMEETAFDLGYSRFHTFRKVIFPLSAVGYQTAALLIFMPTLALYVTPMMLGGTSGVMIGTILSTLIRVLLDFAQGSAFVIPVIASLLAVVLIFRRGINLEKIYRSGVGSSIGRSAQRGSRWLVVYVGAFLFLTYMPFLSMMVFSFTGNPMAVFPMMGFTLQWYGDVLANGELVSAVRTSVVLAAESALVAIVLSAPAAYAIVRYRFPGRGVFLFVGLLPMLIPSLFMAFAIFILLITTGAGLSLQSMVVGHVTLVLPFVFLTILAHQYGFNRDVEEASKDLGSRPLTTVRRVVLPLMVPAILAAAFLAVAISFNDYVVAFILRGENMATLPMYILTQRRHSGPEVNAVGTLLIVGVVLLSALVLLRPWDTVLRRFGRGRLLSGRAPV